METKGVLREKKDPTKCSHATVHRVLDFWECTDCGALFIPKNKAHKTKWQD